MKKDSSSLQSGVNPQQSPNVVEWRSRALDYLPRTVFQALRDILQTKDIQKKIRDGYYEDRFVAIFALPKSLSSHLRDCISSLLSIDENKLPPNNRARYEVVAGGYTDKSLPLRLEALKDYPDGGVLKNHSRAANANIEILNLLNAKCVIHVRHPLDQLTSMYCHRMRHLEVTREALEQGSLMVTPIYPLDPKYFLPSVPVSKAINYMISTGYLFNVLSWIADWQRYRDRRNSVITRYEDLVLNFEPAIDRVSSFLFQRHATRQELDRMSLPNEKNFEEFISNVPPEVYPKGYTGKIGVWKDYLNEDNKHAYDFVVNAFLETHPYGKHLLEIYPNLIDFDLGFDVVSDPIDDGR